MSITSETRGSTRSQPGPKPSVPSEVVVRRHFYWMAALFFLLFDSFSNYMLLNQVGRTVPINILVAFLFGVALFLEGFPKAKWPTYITIGMYCYFLGISVAIIALDEFEISRFRAMATAAVGFAVGYACFTIPKNTIVLRNILFFAGSFYAVVCFIALIKVLPGLFPVIESIGVREGEFFARPEVTTDQNFQIFYLFPAVILLVLRNSTLWLLAILFVSALSAFDLAQLQTRSGALLLCGCILMSAIVGMRSRSQFDYRYLVFGFLGLILVMVFLNQILGALDQILKRFTVDSFRTLDNRASAFSFSFTYLAELSWWVPQGNRAYYAETGKGLPHSTITAAFVEGGILGLIGWVTLIFTPVVALALRWKKGLTDDIANIALCGAVVALIAQLSLNAPLHEHIWLWAGAAVAALGRPAREKTAEELEETSKAKGGIRKSSLRQKSGPVKAQVIPDGGGIKPRSIHTGPSPSTAGKARQNSKPMARPQPKTARNAPAQQRSGPAEQAPQRVILGGTGPQRRPVDKKKEETPLSGVRPKSLADPRRNGWRDKT